MATIAAVASKTGLEFQIEMIEEAFIAHNEECCSADSPCGLRVGLAKVLSGYEAQLNSLIGEGAQGTTVETDRRANGSGSNTSTGRTLRDPATEKQLAFIKSLTANADRDTLSPNVRKHLDTLAKGGQISRTIASKVIEAMKSVSTPAAGGVRPASDKQRTYLRSLIERKGHKQIDMDGLSAKEASELIDVLRTRPDAVDAPALEDGMYRRNGQIYKVQHAVHGSGRQYAKVLADNGDGSFSFQFESGAIARLRAEHRLSLEEAQEFGKIYGVCCVCSRTLTDERSIDAGIGPVCGGRV
jgi:hypothetical protein